jgi:ATP-dependent helicase/nuclease subunit B
VKTVNRVVSALAEICRERPIGEKWLIAPSRRVGNQWLDSVAMGGRAVVNVRVMTLKRMALDLATPEMMRKGVSPVSPVRAEVIADRIWNSLMDGSGAGYLSALKPGMDLSRALLFTVNSLRMAEMAAQDLGAKHFEDGRKAVEIAAVLKEYLAVLKKEKLVDYPDVLRFAIERMKSDPRGAVGDAVILLPENADCEALEHGLIDAIPDENIVRLVSGPEAAQSENDGVMTDIGLLRFINTPAGAPAPFNDGTVKIFHATGRVNEVREVIRRCLAEGVRFDEVELLHTGAENYIPLIYETAERFNEAAGEGGAGLKVTLSEGVPASYSRQGRALAGWIEWMSLNYPRKTLVRMIHDGLLAIGEVDEGRFGFSELAGVLRSVPIGIGRDGYIETIDGEIGAALAGSGGSSGEDEPVDKKRYARARRRKEALGVLRGLVLELLSLAPVDWKNHADVLDRAKIFVAEKARGANELDNYSREKLLQGIGEMKKCVESGEGALSFDVREWLGALPSGTTVMGSGPRPGHLHVDSIYSGGHTGRKRTFIIGMDDSLFPGGSLQDPLLLDGERKNLSDRLIPSSRRIERKMEAFAELLARLDGSLTFGFSSRDLIEDREMFPAAALTSVFRIISGDHGGDRGAFMKWLGRPVSFAPERREECLDETEWWMWRLLGKEKVGNAEALIFRRFPNLERGAKAAARRESAEFTEYDGYVPRAGMENDPFRPDGPVMSAGRLEQVGGCPLGYFFKYILRLEPPEELEADPYTWLDPLAAGQMMHKVFEVFYREMIKEGRPPAMSDRDRLFSIFQKYVDEYKENYPPPTEMVFSEQRRRLERTAWIFLVEEVKLAGASRPVFLEVGIGLPRDSDSEPSPLDSADPVRMKLSGGKEIMVRGRIDRIDEVPGAKGKVFAIWDYKTGSAAKYRSGDPFNKGRVVQHALYTILAELAIRSRIDPEAVVASFGYFFPNPKMRGSRMVWGEDELRERGLDVIGKLCRVAAAGCFLATDDNGACGFCDFNEICLDSGLAGARSAAKLENPGNAVLKTLVELRKDE